MVDEILVAEGDADDALGDEFTKAVPDPPGVAVIGETGRHLVRERQAPIYPAQQQGAGIGSDGAAVEISHHAAASVGFKLEGFGVTLCGHRFSFMNLVNSFRKSILPDSENRCFLPLVRKFGLGRMYALDIIGEDSTEMKTELAEKALVHFEKAYDLSDGRGQAYLLTDLAKMALTANRYEKATGYASAMLALSEDSPDWNSGEHIHHGNLVLGRIALAEGDIEEAKRRLIAAGKTTGSPSLNSFGPDMMLAKELLQKGEKEVVLEYFRLCAGFWELGQDRLEEWSDLVQANRVPDFGGNL